MVLTERNISVLLVNLLLCYKLLDLINGHRFINSAPRTLILAAAITDGAAHSRERIILFDELQSVHISAFCCHLDIALHREMRRTGCLARRCARLVAVDLCMISVVRIPFISSPLLRIRKKRLRVLDLAVLCTQLLSKFRRTHRTDLDTFSARHAFLFLHMCPVCGAGHVRRIKELRRPQSVAHAGRTIADRKNLVLTVDICDLVYKSVPFGPLQYFHHFIEIDIAAFSRLHKIIRHVSHTDAQISLDLPAPFTAHPLLAAAGTGPHCIFVLIFFQPVGDMLHTRGLLMRRDCLLHRNDMHADTGTSGRHHWRHFFQRQSGHVFKKVCNNRMFLGLFLIHHHEFRTSGHEHRKYILFMAVFIFPVVLDHADDRHLVQELLYPFFIFT